MMTLQEFASLKHAFGLYPFVFVFSFFLSVFTRQQTEEIRCSYFFLFSTRGAQSVYLSEGARSVGIDRRAPRAKTASAPTD